MEDENETKEEDQPSTSKKESPDEEMSDNTRHDQRVTTSATSVSGSFLSRSRIDMNEAPPDCPKTVGLNKRGRPKPQFRKRKMARRSGRVEKRHRSFSRRHVRKFSRRKPRIREIKSSEQSVSTIFTRFSSRSASKIQLCANCGHRCCRRRYWRETKRRYRARLKRLRRRNMIKGGRRISGWLIPRVEMVQVGSRSAMLSPLIVNTMSEPAENGPEEKLFPYSEVSPQIIYQSLRKLSVWKQYIMTGDLMDYIRRTYPVNQVESELYEELKEKLRVAAIAGFVIEPYEDNWCLACAMKERQLSPNHVTLFWKAYIDTISPLQKTRFRVKEEESSELAVKS